LSTIFSNYVDILTFSKSDDNFISNTKFTSCYNIIISKRLWQKYVIFIELCMKEDILAYLKGK